MAASEAILSSWKTPFSTPIRKDGNACRDLFQNSEKLLASAVSICRLKGSVECQTGGLITVCEELQSLIRLAFTGELVIVATHTVVFGALPYSLVVLVSFLSTMA